MKNKIVFSVLFSVNVVYSEFQYCPVSNKDSGYIHNGQLVPKCTENDSPEIWSGSWEDLQAVAKRVKEKFSFETTKHKSRDIASLKPASKQEMEKHISNGNYQEWSAYIFDSYHEPSDTVDDVLMEVLGSYYMSKDVSTGTKEEKRVSAMMKFTNEINKALKFLKNKVFKYTNPDGGEVVYDKETGKIILNSRLGTKNFGKSYEWIGVKIQEYLKTQDWFKYTPQGMSLKVEAAIIREVGKYIPGDHFLLDVVPHEKDNQYKYAGILFESDSDGRFYIVDGQTGKRMTKKQVEDFPTTFSDMWKDKGLVCVESDAVDIVPPKENRQSAQNASSEDGNGGVKGVVAKSDATSSDESTRKICICAEPETFFAGVVMLRILFTEVKKPSARYYCRKCGGFRSGKMFDVVRTGNGIATYPAGVLPPDWDGKIYEETELDEHVKNLLSGFDNSTKATEGR